MSDDETRPDRIRRRGADPDGSESASDDEASSGDDSDTEDADGADTPEPNTEESDGDTGDEPTSRAERLRTSREGGGGRADRISRGRSGRRDGTPAADVSADETGDSTADTETDTAPATDTETEPDATEPDATEPDETDSETGETDSDEHSVATGSDMPTPDTTESSTSETTPTSDTPAVSAETPETATGDSDEAAESAPDTATESAPATDTTASSGESSPESPSAPETARHEGAHPTAPFEVVEFRLDGETFALAIDYVEAIEELADVTAPTRVPGTPAHTLGVTAVRGQTTTVVDPDRTLGTASGVADGDGERTVLVLDDDTLAADRQVAVLVDRVRAVTTVDPETIADPPTPDDHVAGVIDRGDEFLVWVAPTFALGSV